MSRNTLENVEPIDAEFSTNGFDYKLIKRQGNVVIYEQRSNGKIQAYEVMLVRVTPENVFPNGIRYPAREVLPSTATWGDFGWTCLTLADANRRVSWVLKNRKNAVS